MVTDSICSIAYQNEALSGWFFSSMVIFLILWSQDYHACVHCIMLLLSPRSRDYWARSRFQIPFPSYASLASLESGFFKHLLLLSCSIKCFCWFWVKIIKHNFVLNYASLASQESGLLSTFLVFSFRVIFLILGSQDYYACVHCIMLLLSPWSWDY